MIRRLLSLMYGPCFCACPDCKRGQHCNGFVCAHDA